MLDATIELSTRDLLAAASGDRGRLRTTAVPEATSVLTHAGATVAADGNGTLTVSGMAYLDLTRDAAAFRAEVAL